MFARNTEPMSPSNIRSKTDQQIRQDMVSRATGYINIVDDNIEKPRDWGCTSKGNEWYIGFTNWLSNAVDGLFAT